MRLRRAAVDAMIAHARAESPMECCGLLIGSGDLIDECRPALNVRQSRVAYEVDPRDHFAAIRDARRTGRQVLGAYHSHPSSPAVPSPTDVAEAFDPELLYVIVSLRSRDPEVRGFRIAGGTVSEISLLTAV